MDRGSTALHQNIPLSCFCVTRLPEDTGKIVVSRQQRKHSGPRVRLWEILIAIAQKFYPVLSIHAKPGRSDCAYLPRPFWSELFNLIACRCVDVISRSPCFCPLSIRHLPARAIWPLLNRPQRMDRVRRSRAPCGNCRCQQCHQHHHQDTRHVNQRVGGAHLKEERMNQPGDCH